VHAVAMTTRRADEAINAVDRTDPETFANTDPRDYWRTLRQGTAGQSAEDAWAARGDILMYFADLMGLRRGRTIDDVITVLANTLVDGRPMGGSEVVLNCYSLILGRRGDQPADHVTMSSASWPPTRSSGAGGARARSGDRPRLPDRDRRHHRRTAPPPQRTRRRGGRPAGEPATTENCVSAARPNATSQV
jgi:hypothetical protein